MATKTPPASLGIGTNPKNPFNDYVLKKQNKSAIKLMKIRIIKG